MTKSNDTGEILLKVWKSHQGPAAETYDEVLRDVSRHAHEERSIGKTDIGALVVWKRLNASTRWAKKLMLTPESRVRESTGKAWWIANDDTRSIADAGGAARGELREVPGLGGGGAIASAVLVALAPSRMAVWDKRVRITLETMGWTPTPGSETYASYLEIVTQLAQHMQLADGAGHEFLPRDVDLALFHAADDVEVLDSLRCMTSDL